MLDTPFQFWAGLSETKSNLICVISCIKRTVYKPICSFTHWSFPTLPLALHLSLFVEVYMYNLYSLCSTSTLDLLSSSLSLSLSFPLSLTLLTNSSTSIIYTHNWEDNDFGLLQLDIPSPPLYFIISQKIKLDPQKPIR